MRIHNILCRQKHFLYKKDPQPNWLRALEKGREIIEWIKEV